MASRMSRASLRTFYLRALADADPVTAQYYFQKMQAYDEAFRLYGLEAAKATLPKTRVRRKAGRLALQKAYLDALKAGDTEKADALAAKIATRDRSGMQDDKRYDLPDHVLAEFDAVLAGLR